jgi:hypothetical protein
MRDSWLCIPHNVNHSIKDFTLRATKWNRKLFGNIFHMKKRLLAHLGGIQKALCIRPCFTLLDLERDLTGQYQDILRMEEEFLALKSRIQWSILGDRNTSFFHLSTDLQNLIRSHFVKLYTTEEVSSNRSSHAHINCTFLTEDGKSLLENFVSNQEIENAFKSFKPIKAPGPDGLYPIFFQKF